MVANRMQVPHYYAYLLRCWPEGDLLQPDAPASRFSIEDPYTGERQDFATLEALVAFLHELSACDAMWGTAWTPSGGETIRGGDD